MAAKLQRPILVGGVTLAIALWLLETLSHALGELGLYGLIAGAIGGGIWWLQQRSSTELVAAPIAPQKVNAAIVKKALTETETLITHLQTELAEPATNSIVLQPRLTRLQSQMQQLETEMERQQLRLLVMGGKGVGKTRLIQALTVGWISSPRSLSLTEAPSFSGTNAAGLTAEVVALQQAIASDLVLFIVTGDLTDSEFYAVKQVAACKRTVLVFNKQDQYFPEEQQAISTRIQERLAGLTTLKLVTIAADPNPLKVRQHQADGSIKEWSEAQSAAIAPLTQELDQILRQESQQLVLASTLTQTVTLKTEVKTTLNDLRRDRALPVVEQFQWMAAATAFASPLVAVDLVAALAINTQMIMDLGTIYRQKFSLSQAQKMATTLGSLALKLGLVEVSTRTIASLMKTNLVTYVAGGCIQGISAAYLTRVVGLSLIEYFHTQEPYLTATEAQPLAIERFSAILETVFQRHQQVTLLQSFVKQGIDRLSPAPTPMMISDPVSRMATPVSQPVLDSSIPIRH
jgi:hypothetical protein